MRSISRFSDLGVPLAVVVVLAAGLNPASAASRLEACTFKVQPQSAIAEWIAYKTTRKVGVKGTFEGIRFDFPRTPMKLASALKSAWVTLDVKAARSGDPARDANLKNHFFGLFVEPKVRGSLQDVRLEADGQRVRGTAGLRLQMNKSIKVLPAQIEIDEAGLFVLRAEMNVLDFGLAKALAALNKACFELHKGEDKVSKTWPDVSLLIQAMLDVRCD
jgi:hypothetical protein